jgi:hypothetical protein
MLHWVCQLTRISQPIEIARKIGDRPKVTFRRNHSFSSDPIAALVVSLIGAFAFGCDGAKSAVKDGGSGMVDPFVKGPCRFEKRPELIVRDGRQLFATLLLPEADLRCSDAAQSGIGLPPRSKKAPWPLVLIAPTIQQNGNQYLGYAEHVASYGYAAVIVDYPDDPIIADNRELAADLAFVVDWLDQQNRKVGHADYRRFDLGRVGLLGHGSGAIASLLAQFADPRVKAVAALDPVDGHPLADRSEARFPSLVPQRSAQLTMPLLLLGTTESARCSGACRPCVPLGESYLRFYDAASGPVIERVLLGSGHHDLLDDPQCGFLCDRCSPGPADSAETRRLARGFMLSFFQLVLRELPSYISTLCDARAKTKGRCRLGELGGRDAGTADGGGDAGADGMFDASGDGPGDASDGLASD